MATIVITRTIQASREAVYQAFLDPQANLVWNHADDSWYTPHAEIDAKIGGSFNIGYAAKDGSASFDFVGTFTELIEPEKISYTIADGRPVWIVLKEVDSGTEFSLELTLETENSEELQRQGWTMIVNRLAEYVEKQTR